jgi:hypothetical protein
MGLNFDEFKWAELHERHAVAAWDLGTISATSQTQRESKKTCVEMAGRGIFRMVQSCKQNHMVDSVSFS